MKIQEYKNNPQLHYELKNEIIRRTTTMSQHLNKRSVELWGGFGSDISEAPFVAPLQKITFAVRISVVSLAWMTVLI